MSPIIHAGVGWLVGSALPTRRARALVTAAAVVPDLDGAGLLISDDLYLAWHHKLAHGAPFALVLAALVLLAAPRGARVATAALAVVAFHSHIVLDLVGSGPGWPIFYLWPFDDVEWLPSWQWNLASWQNTVFGLAVVLVCLSASLWRGRTPVELASLRADAAVVSTLRRRFAPRASSS
jgi:inner membrane protein